jgi:hypothetical protein
VEFPVAIPFFHSCGRISGDISLESASSVWMQNDQALTKRIRDLLPNETAERNAETTVSNQQITVY